MTKNKEALLFLHMIKEATQWLLALTESRIDGLESPLPGSMRVYTEEECEYLPLPCRRFLLAMEQQKVVDPALRERIIHHALELRVKNVDLHVIEGITRIILSRCPESAKALARMELFMAEAESFAVH